MKEFLNKITDKISETHEAMMENMETFFSVEKLTEKLTNASDSARDKAAKHTSDLIALSPIIEDIGFKTKSITIGMGLPPSVTIHFQKVKDISPKRRQEILDEHKDKKMLLPLVKTLIATDDFQKKIAVGSFKFSSISLDIGLTPGVNMDLVPKE